MVSVWFHHVINTRKGIEGKKTQKTAQKKKK
jgi:hypothetical protein